MVRAGSRPRRPESFDTCQARCMTEAIRDADEESFAELIEPYRRELHAHCYRMLGSVHDADDALQHCSLKGAGRLRGPQLAALLALRDRHERLPANSPGTQAARAARRRRTRDDPREPLGGPLAESVWIEPYPDELLRYEDRSASSSPTSPPSAPAAQPARFADPARGARLQRSGGCRDPRDLGRLGEQRPAAGPREARAGARPAHSRRRCGRWATSAPASSSPVSSTPGTAPTSRGSSRC